jgi:hypothetical protein
VTGIRKCAEEESISRIVDSLHEKVESYEEEASKETGKGVLVAAETDTRFKNPCGW